MKSEYKIGKMVCIKTVESRSNVLFTVNKEYELKIYKSFAVAKDNTGCIQTLYTKKDDKFFKKHFKLLQV